MPVQSGDSLAKSAWIIFIVFIINNSDLFVMVLDTFLEMILKPIHLLTVLNFCQKHSTVTSMKNPNDIVYELTVFNVYKPSKRKSPRYTTVLE